MATKSIGNVINLLFLSALLLLATSAANAMIVVTLDRQQITVDDTFTMTVRVTEGEDLEDIDLSPLHSNFDILGRSQNSRHIFGSGGNESWSELTLSLAPKHTGTLYIPALALGNLKTTATQIIVRESSPLPTGAMESVFIEVETDKDSVHVQEQLIFTIRIFQSINLDNPSISELKLGDSFVEQISQNSGQRRLNNTPYLVHEIKYAIFPQKSGELTIPSLTFSGTQLNRRRSLFDMGGQGKLFRKLSKAKAVTVKPIPSNIKTDSWLPAEQFTIEENWSSPPEKLAIGESTTRTLTIKAKGLLSEQLPPLLPPEIEGIKLYPDQPKLENQHNELGVSSLRIDSSAIVITKAGSFTIPGIKFPWWDTSQNKLRWASIPPRNLQIKATANSNVLNNAPLSIASSELALSANNAVTKPIGNIATVSADSQQLRLWQLLASVAALAWLFTTLILIKTRKRLPNVFRGSGPLENENEKKLYQKLIKTCKTNNPGHQRAAIIQWAQSYWQSPSITTVSEVAEKIGDSEIKILLSELNASLYSPADNNWDSASFMTLVNQYKKQKDSSSRDEISQLQTLYSAPSGHS